ncbi:MAG: M23 family metallopeptidase, partial [Gallionellaceae bacterium]|nr:M23 family metallopeptidase [Gallionellaceae bacterium]
VPLALPFVGAWTVSQGFSGQYTHRVQWRYDIDFIVLYENKSFANKGNQLTDFYCYNKPVLAPAYGQVWMIANDVPDNAPGTINVAANWGNYVVIRLYDGKFAMIAHLKPGTVAVSLGAWIKAGDFIGYCGNSGRSPQPHIHLHLQASDEIAAATIPFHLASVLVSEHNEAPRYELAHVPQESATLSSAVVGEVRPLYLLAGRGLRYTVAHNENIHADWSLHCEVDNLGRFTLVSSEGGRCLAESTWAVFSCYERTGNADPYLDLWLLACGFTPASFQIERWQDRSTPAKLLPSSLVKLLAAVAWPWATFAKSDYQRHWDGEAQGWRQIVQHRQVLSGMELKAEALILPQLGCSYLAAAIGHDRYTFQATSSFQRADVGVPAWESPLKPSTALTKSAAI